MPIFRALVRADDVVADPILLLVVVASFWFGFFVHFVILAAGGSLGVGLGALVVRVGSECWPTWLTHCWLSCDSSKDPSFFLRCGVLP